MKVKPFWILMKQDMMGWQWHQLDHMQTDNHASTSSLNFLQAKCSSWCPTNSVKALKPTNSMWFPGFLFSLRSAEAQVRWVGKIIHLLIVSGERLCKKNCQAHNLNREDAMDHGRWKKLIKTGWWSGWRVGECFFWYRLTRVLPDKGP